MQEVKQNNLTVLENDQSNEQSRIFSYVSEKLATVDLETRGKETRLTLVQDVNAGHIRIIYPRGWAITLSDRGEK